jgi:NAD(P)-dependent dehydrogenase (short-subunit alcohol dehydrogenase family)
MNLYGTIYCVKAAAPHMKKNGWGKIVTIRA